MQKIVTGLFDVMYNRIVDLSIVDGDSVFVFGARQTGKSTLLMERYPDATWYDLLDGKTLERLSRNPALLGQELSMLPDNSLVVIDEVPLLPELLNEVHRLIVRKNLRFILCGSSARKLKRQGINTLGGRAIPIRLFPLVSAEIPDFDLIRAVNQGLLPRHYMATPDVAWRRMQAYIGVYLKEEIKAESLVRNLQAFNRFMEVAALTDGEMVNYSNIANDCGIDSKTVKEYFAILEETLVGYMIPAYQKAVKRKLRQSPKFYYFDVCIPNYLLGRKALVPGSADFGHSFEHLIIQELIAYLSYRNIENAISYWHTYSEHEVDAVLGDAQVAIEIKSSNQVQARQLSGLRLFKEEHPEARLIVVSLDAKPRQLNDIEIYPATIFLQKLWNDEILK